MLLLARQSNSGKLGLVWRDKTELGTPSAPPVMVAENGVEVESEQGRAFESSVETQRSIGRQCLSDEITVSKDGEDVNMSMRSSKSPDDTRTAEGYIALCSFTLKLNGTSFRVARDSFLIANMEIFHSCRERQGVVDQSDAQVPNWKANSLDNSPHYSVRCLKLYWQLASFLLLTVYDYDSVFLLRCEFSISLQWSMCLANSHSLRCLHSVVPLCMGKRLSGSTWILARWMSSSPQCIWVKNFTGVA